MDPLYRCIFAVVATVSDFLAQFSNRGLVLPEIMEKVK